MPLRLSPPLTVHERSWSGLCLHLRRLGGQVAPAQSLHLPLSGLGSALPVKGSPTSRAFTRAVSGVVSSERTVKVPPESGVLPVTPRGSAISPCRHLLRLSRDFILASAKSG